MEQNAKKISVIIPCYNVETYIDRCMTSIMIQTIGVKNLEVICVDDASTDDTWIHLKAWEKLFPDNIILIRLETNGRQGRARNLGFQRVSTDWVSFVDSDDWLEPDYFEQLYNPLAKFDCDVISCGEERDFSETLTFFDDEIRSGTHKEDQYIVADTEEIRKFLIITMPAGGGALQERLSVSNYL